MFFFGHMGIGSKLVSPFTHPVRGLPRRWVLLGTVIPDLIDKPLYYGLAWITGNSGPALGLISGTRTFGHTGLLTLLMALAALSGRSRILGALAIGMGTHLLLDGVADLFEPNHLEAATTALAGSTPLLWPLNGASFPITPFENIHDHMGRIRHPFVVLSEIVGLFLLGWDFWKARHQPEILSFIRKKGTKRQKSQRKNF